MSFLKKTLASFGIGSAKVDSVLQQEVLYPGKKASIIVHVYGGAQPQEIDNIDLNLCCRYVKEVTMNSQRQEGGHKRRMHQTYSLAKWSLPYAFVIQPGETRDFECEFDVPLNTPVTIGDSKVWLETGLDIAMAIDPSDKDILTVRPDALLDGIFNELEAHGLRIRQVECEAVEGFELPFVQEFEFVPTTGPYHGRWRELEVVAHRDETELKLWFEIDRNRDGAKGMLASLLGVGQLQRQLSVPLDTSPEEAGKMVLEYLDSAS
ncbi:sporulation protein [Vibrio cyclitrophicus]|uniref:sporulation protein n=1 Tax=Vibrio splendidus TaxID=29497 RepID=UPI00205821A5|nr:MULTISPECIES: sporulation protein [Vibrio]UPR35780.1 sporulation protein [Vibrio cyclitrophicus]UPR47375.1 sporulation protein [Vibrio cyclitrophicus]UPR52159.1 sporulation protein [Vibrio cyclitrophicus]UWZ97147.1 sporulation protein [Vibrio splendidus]